MGILTWPARWVAKQLLEMSDTAERAYTANTGALAGFFLLGIYATWAFMTYVTIMFIIALGK